MYIFKIIDLSNLPIEHSVWYLVKCYNINILSLFVYKEDWGGFLEKTEFRSESER